MAAIGSNSHRRIAPIATVGTIGSNSCGDELRKFLPRGSNWEQFVWTNRAICSRGSNWEQFVWCELRQLLPWQQLGAIRIDKLRQLLPWEQLGRAIRVVTNCANSSRGSNWEQFVWTNCANCSVGTIGSNSCGDEMRKFLPWQQLGAIRVD